MSQADGGSGSRHTNQTNSVRPGEPGNSASGDSASGELPTPRECLAEFVDEYPDRAQLDLTAHNGVKLRRDYTDGERDEWYADGPRPQDDDVNGFETSARRPVSWGSAVYRLLKDHVEDRQSTLNLERGQPGDAEHAEFSVDVETRWFASYQKEKFAEMNAWLRELCGGERPSGGETDPEYENPHIVLLTFSGSSTPDGDRLGPVDHANALRESWSDCYHALRNRMRSLGMNWQYDRRSEPHTGKRGDQTGTNACYSHDHVVMVVDGEITASDLRPVIEKHVENCEIAGRAAHDLDVADWTEDGSEVGTVTVKKPSEVENVAAYVADYCSIEPVDLLERSPEYHAWAASVAAGNIQTVTRSDAAVQAATADQCKQRAESDRCDQTSAHGQRLRRSDRRGCSIECAECGSPHGIDQDQTLTSARRDAAEVQAVADGGLDVDEQRRDDLRDRWPSARAAAQRGETATRAERRSRISNYLASNPDASPTHVVGALGLPSDARALVLEELHDLDRDNAVGIERAPEWRVKSLTVGESEYPASPGGGVDLVETSGMHDAHVEKLNALFEDGQRYRCDCGTAADAHEDGGIAGHLTTHGITDPEQAASVVSRDPPGTTAVD